MTTATKQAYDWERLTKIPRGHKYFRDNNTGKIAVADDSGSFPHTTEDGVLWVILDKPICLQEQHESSQMYGMVSVLQQRTGKELWIGAGPRAILWLVRTFGMNIKVQTIDFGEQDEDPKVEDQLMFIPVGD